MHLTPRVPAEMVAGLSLYSQSYFGDFPSRNSRMELLKGVVENPSGSTEYQCDKITVEAFKF